MNIAITVRDLTLKDIPFILNYWFASPAGFIEAMGVDPAKMPTREEMEKALTSKVEANALLPLSALNALVIEAGGKAVGFHTLFPFEAGGEGIFHAHIWDPAFRGRGIGMKSYPLACLTFLRRFNLQRILFKTPVQNVGAIKVKQKLRIRETGSETIGFGIIREGTPALVFELTRDEAQRLWECPIPAR